MKRRVLTVGVVLAVMAGIIAWSQFQPERLTASALEKGKVVQRKLNDAASAPETTVLAQAPAAAPAAPVPAPAPAAPAKPEEAKQGGANVFKVKFECSNGTFVVECHRDWAPLGVARFEELVKGNFYNAGRFFRVVPGFVVQFGLSGDPETNKNWRTNRIKDDPVKESNAPGTLTFATSGPNSRTTQLFINLAPNKQLDSMGFAPFGKVIEGLEVVKAINAEYRERPDQQQIQTQGNAYLEKEFPKLDFIKSATIVP